MQKMIALAAVAAAALLFAGCTSIDSTDRFNSMPLDDAKYPPVAHVNVRMSGFYLFHCLPIVCGSAASSGKTAMFKDTVTLENAMRLMTKEARGMGGDRLHDINSSFSSFVVPLLFSIDRVEVSGTATSNTPPERRQN